MESFFVAKIRNLVRRLKNVMKIKLCLMFHKINGIQSVESTLSPDSRLIKRSYDIQIFVVNRAQNEAPDKKEPVLLSCLRYPDTITWQLITVPFCVHNINDGYNNFYLITTHEQLFSPLEGVEIILLHNATFL